MNKEPEYLLWRVDWYHRDGYQAPFQLIEVRNKPKRMGTRREARKFAMRQRLADFRKSWSFTLTCLN